MSLRSSLNCMVPVCLQGLLVLVVPQRLVRSSVVRTLRRAMQMGLMIR